MPRQHWWTSPFRVVKRDGRLYRLGSAEYGIPVWGSPRFTWVYAALLTMLTIWPLLKMAGVPVNPDTICYVYLPLPFIAGWLTKVQVRDGKRSHEWAVAMLTLQVNRRVGTTLPGHQRIRPRQLRHTVTVEAWTPLTEEQHT